MINNFERIKSLLQFDNEDYFYYCQIIKRKKENEGLGSNNFVAKSYYISSLEELERNKDEMICLAEHHKARVCINLNRRSFEKIAFNTLLKVTNQLMNKDFKSIKKAYSSVCGLHSVEKNKIWIIDVDTKEKRKVVEIEHFINLLHKKLVTKEEYHVIDILETVNGYHIISNPFNMQDFSSEYPTIDVHKDNPTILYANL